MSFRGLLLGFGVLLVLAGFVLTVAWFNQMNAPAPVTAVETPKPEIRMTSILVASHDISAGSLLRSSDVNWKQVPQNEVRPGFLELGQAQEADYLGAITRRDVASGAALSLNDFVKPSEQRLLSSTLTKGSRAVTLAFEPPQSAAGLASSSAFAQPGDRVDVILTQQLDTPGDPGRRLLGDTILRDLKVIALDRLLAGAAKSPAEETKPGRGEAVAGPRTVTFEVTEAQAQVLLVGAQLGKLHLSVRPALAAAVADDDGGKPQPTWAADIAPALLDLPPRQSGQGPVSTIESSIRRLPAPVH